MLATPRKAGFLGVTNSPERTLVIEYNKLVTDVQAIITAAATSIAAVAAVVPTAAKIQNNNGVEYTQNAG